MNSATAPAWEEGDPAGGWPRATLGWPPRPGPTIPCPTIPCAPTLRRELVVEAQTKAQHAAVANEAVLKVPNALIPMGLWPRFSVSRLCVRGELAQSQERPRKPVRKEAGSPWQCPQSEH